MYVLCFEAESTSDNVMSLEECSRLIFSLTGDTGVEGEALLHMEELGNYTLKYLARRRTRKPPHDLVTGRTPDYMLSN